MSSRRWLRSLPIACSIVLLLTAVALPAQRGGDEELPLEAASTIRFTTDEGTWISLDVDPSGDNLVFELLGDLYELPLAGGDARRLTSGMAYDSQPSVSPDGQWIAFVSDRDGNNNLWVAARDGSSPRKLSSGRSGTVISPSWTPDSNYVLVTQTGGRGAQVRMYHVNGGSGITVGGGGGSEEGDGGGGSSPTRLGVQMSPDGNYLYFAQSTGGSSGIDRWQIARMDLRGGEVDVLTQAEGAGIRPALSPDGTRLVYGTRYETRTGLRVRDLETGDDRWVIWPVQRDEIESGGAPSRDTFPGYSFTPDGAEIVVTFDGKIQRVNVDSGAVTPVPFTVDVELEVGPDLTQPYRLPQGPVRARLVQSPAVSPDGSKLVFSVLTKLYVMDAVETTTDDAMVHRRSVPAGDGGPMIHGGSEFPDGATAGVVAGQVAPARLTSGDAWEFKPAWSPDGQWIAYVTWSMNDGGHIWKTLADGSGEPQRLTTYPAFYTDIAFSPDGERIVGLRGNEYMRHQTFSEFGGLRIPLDLIWLPADGGDPELVVPARGVGAPHFADDPDRIYVYSRDGLISLRYDGTDRRTHLRVTGPGRAGSTRPPAADTVVMSPDGDWALAKVSNQLWIVAVPPAAGEAPTVNVRSPSVPAKRITDIGADYFGWADGGETIYWAIGSTVFRRPFDSIDFTPAGDDDDEAGEEAEAGAADEGEEAAAEQEGEGDEQQEEEEFEPLDEDDAVEAIEVVLEFPRATPEGTIALRGATVITMAGGGDGPVIENADIVVVDNRIRAVGARGEVAIPAGARELDVAGKYIVPGFIDTHAHWEFRTHDVLEPHNWTLVANLAYGVTAGLDVQTSTNDYFAYQDLVDTGQSIGQRAFMTGPGVFSDNDFRSYEATLAYLTRYKQHYRTPNIKSYMVGNRQQRQWVVKAAQELGLMPTTEGGRDMMLDITHAIDGMHGNEHTLPVVPLYKDVVELYAQTRTAYTPTLLVQYGGPIARLYFFTRTEVHDDPKLNRFYPHNRLDEMTRRVGSWARDDEFAFDEAAAQAAKIQRAGGLVGVGAHGEVQGLGYHWEMWALASGGMTPREVLQAATIDGARIIGFDADLGSVEEGKLADLVVLDSNPLDDIENTNSVAWVMKNGELYEGDTLDQVWPVERPLPAFWWWDAEPPARDGGQ